MRTVVQVHSQICQMVPDLSTFTDRERNIKIFYFLENGILLLKNKTTERYRYKLHLTHLMYPTFPKHNWLPVSSLIVFGSCFLIFSYVLGCPSFFFNLLCFAIFIKLLTSTEYFHSKKRKKEKNTRKMGGP